MSLANFGKTLLFGCPNCRDIVKIIWVPHGVLHKKYEHCIKCKILFIPVNLDNAEMSIEDERI